MRIFRAATGCLLVFCLSLGGARAAAAGRPDATPWVIGSAGTFALVEQYDYPYLFGLQYRWKPRTSWELMPGLGAAVGPDGMGYFFADIARDFALPRQWTMTLSLAAGLFLNGDAIGANEHLEFQSGIAFARRLRSGVRVGIAGYHISNGGLAHPNNGTEALVLFVAVPVGSGR